MKKCGILLLLFVCMTGFLCAQTTHDKISYQSVVRNAENKLLYDTEMTVDISISNEGSDVVVYKEKHTVMSNANGLISFMIGEGTDVEGDWDNVKWNAANVTLKTSVEGEELSTHTLPLSAVPYAFNAKQSESASYADSADINIVKRYVEAQGFLQEEEQALRISNDTVYLTGGSFVKLPAQKNADWNATDGVEQILNKPNLATVATSGSYNDLEDKPTIPTVNDLLAVFDSLSRRIAALEAQVEEIKNDIPHISLNINGPEGDNLNLCGNASVTYSYTAELTGNVDLTGYTYSWTVNDVIQTETSDVLEYIFTSTGNFIITCTITKDGRTLSESINTSITNSGTQPTLILCETPAIKTVKVIEKSANTTIDWGGTGSENGETYVYTNPGVYTITATETSGCSVSKQVALGGATIRPCTAAVLGTHTAQTDFSGGGHNNANDGLETVNEEGAVTSVTDYDGNVYPVVEIGSQCWLAENMRCTHSPSTGAYIVNPLNGQIGEAYGYTGDITNNGASSFTSRVALWYANDSISYAPKGAGLLYNWCAAVDVSNKMFDNDNEYLQCDEDLLWDNNVYWNANISEKQRGICPKGWHVSSDEDWKVLEKYLVPNISDNESNVPCAAFLATGCDWIPYDYKDEDDEYFYFDTEPESPGDYYYTERNKTFFNIVPSGEYNYDEWDCNDVYFTGSEDGAYFWTSTQEQPVGLSSDYYDAISRTLSTSSKDVMRKYGQSVPKAECKSVRCVRD